MMKTIFIIWVERLNVLRGGVHRIIHILLEYLPKYGYEVHYLYTTDNYRTFHHYLAENEDEEIFLSELRQYLLDYHCRLLIGQDAGLSSRLSSMIHKWNIPNMKYITEYHNSILLIEKVLSKHYWRLTIRNGNSFTSRFLAVLRFMFYPIWLHSCRKSVVQNFLANYTVANRLVILSKFELPVIKNRVHADISKCIVINNPLSWRKIEDASILSKKKKEVLIVSRLYNPEKRIDSALHIWQILERRGFVDWTLRIVGTGVHEEYLKNLTGKLNLRQVRFEGRQDPYPYYLTASLFMMTSTVEGWGLTLTESMQTGTVPLAFDSYPALHDIITDGYDGCIVEEGNLEAYADRMEQLMIHKDERERIARNGLESCKRFEINKIINQWVDLIKSL